jgi:hypothetical protein
VRTVCASRRKPVNFMAGIPASRSPWRNSPPPACAASASHVAVSRGHDRPDRRRRAKSAQSGTFDYLDRMSERRVR